MLHVLMRAELGGPIFEWPGRKLGSLPVDFHMQCQGRCVRLTLYWSRHGQCGQPV